VDLESGDALYYYLGDVLQSATDVDEVEARGLGRRVRVEDGCMESYEWIRIDADFELSFASWTKMPAYMHISQLQRDRT